jgi:hypothetical protein
LLFAGNVVDVEVELLEPENPALHASVEFRGRAKTFERLVVGEQLDLRTVQVVAKLLVTANTCRYLCFVNFVITYISLSLVARLIVDNMYCIHLCALPSERAPGRAIVHVDIHHALSTRRRADSDGNASAHS